MAIVVRMFMFDNVCPNDLMFDKLDVPSDAHQEERKPLKRSPNQKLETRKSLLHKLREGIDK